MVSHFFVVVGAVDPLSSMPALRNLRTHFSNNENIDVGFLLSKFMEFKSLFVYISFLCI